MPSPFEAWSLRDLAPQGDGVERFQPEAICDLIAAMNQSRTYAVVLEPEAEGGFTVRVPALPEIVSYGDDEREALAMAEDAIRLVIEDRRVGKAKRAHQ
jgi:antitoxin HicB